MATTINIKDLPDAGLNLIGPQHSAFPSEFAAFARARGDADVLEAIRPACVMLKNNSAKAVVACRFVWELTRADGSVVTRTTDFGNPIALMEGSRLAAAEQVNTTQGHAIPPGMWRVISPTHVNRRGSEK